MPSRIARLGWKLFQPLLRRLRPSEHALQNLSQKDRPGLTIELPELVTCDELLRQGRAQLGQDNHAGALSLFRKALELQVSNPWVWHGIGDAHQLNGDYKEALEAYDRAITIQPQQGLHHGGRANALRGLQQKAESLSAEKIALELDPTLAELFNWRKDAGHNR